MDAVNFFREDLSEIIGAYFDGEKIFILHLTEEFDMLEVDADGLKTEQLAEKISLACRQRGWQTSAVGFCLQDSEVVTFQAEVGNVPEKEIPALVKSWATAQAGEDAAFAFTRLDGELWMETLPQARFKEICAAFEKFGLKLRALSVMPNDLLIKDPFDRAAFITAIVREKKSPNLLETRSSVLNLKKIFPAIAAIFFGIMLIASAKILLDCHTAQSALDSAKISLDEKRIELAIKNDIDTDIAELNRLNKICAAQNISPTKFNFLLNLGKVAGGGVRLTQIHVDEDSLELEGLATTPDAVKSYLNRVKNSVAISARLENSSERDDGDFVFRIRAKF